MRVATGYTNLRGEKFILIINEALYLPSLENLLINPYQLRHFGIDVEDNPYWGEPMMIQKLYQENGDFVVALKSSGTTIFIDT